MNDGVDGVGLCWCFCKALVFIPPVFGSKVLVFAFHVGVWSSFLVNLLAALSSFLASA